METRQQGTTLFSAIVVLIVTLVIIQIWIVASGLDAYLSGQREVLLPAAALSGGLFILNGGLLLYVLAFDSRLRRSSHD